MAPARRTPRGAREVDGVHSPLRRALVSEAKVLHRLATASGGEVLISAHGSEWRVSFIGLQLSDHIARLEVRENAHGRLVEPIQLGFDGVGGPDEYGQPNRDDEQERTHWVFPFVVGSAT
jgi:hypothetical protein